MPLMMDRDRIPPAWAERKQGCLMFPASDLRVVKVALINNMPDPALEDTELQFFELLEAAGSEMPIQVELFSLPGLPRGERAREHLAKSYSSTDELVNRRFDGVIITGTEPRQPDLREEPYWSSLTTLFDWAERNTSSAVLSCLAAHAGVLHSDGIKRQRLKDKRFGVFDSQRTRNHELLDGVGDLARFPHSRWNEVRVDELTSCGYTVLTHSPEAGVDIFVKQKRASLFVHFQGHPEYGARTLLKEYRRDIKRFLRKERPTYPSMPHGYFDERAAKLLADFRESAVSDIREERIQDFPEAGIASALQKTWHSTAISVYRNWLQLIAARKSEGLAFAAVAQVARRWRAESGAIKQMERRND
jgi:homoserine O-succinyltransferase/O-acetyltransferase